MTEIVDEQYTAFKGLPWFDVMSDGIYMAIGGAGGIGSYLSYFLTRAGFKIQIFDYDTIEKRNLSGQLYKNSDIGKKKVDALYNTIKEFSPSAFVMAMDKRIDSNTNVMSPYFFSAFDNMEARKIFFELWKGNIDYYSNPYYEYNGVIPVPIFIDGRLEAEQLQIFCVTKERISEYEKYLFSDSDIEDVACTMKQTSHVASMIATFMTSFFTNHVTNMIEKNYVRDVPFKFEIFTPLTLINRI